MQTHMTVLVLIKLGLKLKKSEMIMFRPAILQIQS